MPMSIIRKRFISNRIGIRTMKIINDKNVYYRMIKGSIILEDISLIVQIPNNRS